MTVNLVTYLLVSR